MDIREAKIPTGVAVCEALVIKSEEVEHGGVKIVNVHGLVHRAETEFIRGAVSVTAARAAAGEPAGEAVVVVVATVEGGILCDGCAAEFAAPEHERTVEQSAPAEIGEEGGERLVPFAGKFTMGFLEAVVVVPRLAVAAPYLDEAHTAFEKSPRHQELPSVRAATVGLANVFGLTINIEHIDGLRLHPEGQLKSLDACLELRVGGTRF